MDHSGNDKDETPKSPWYEMFKETDDLMVSVGLLSKIEKAGLYDDFDVYVTNKYNCTIMSLPPDALQSIVKEFLDSLLHEDAQNRRDGEP
jgi:hypothetical protein